MKYIFAKENPFAPVNTEIKVIEQSAYVSIHYSPSTKELEAPPDKIQKLITEGWIAKAKPKEVWVNYYDFKGCGGSNYGQLFDTEGEAVRAHDLSRNAKIIHFIEADD